MSSRRASGFTLIEMVIAIVIISVGLAGVLMAFNTAVKSSADPMIHKQMLAVAEEMMEEVLLKPFDPVVPVSTNSLKNCGGASPPSREAFNDVTDYHGYQTNGICTIEGVAVPGLETPYGLTVTVAPAGDLGTGSSSISISNVKKVTVTVNHGTSEALTLVGWRTWYACELPTGCPP